MKTLMIFILMLSISMFAQDVKTTDGLIIDGKIEQKTKEGIIVNCMEIEYSPPEYGRPKGALTRMGANPLTKKDIDERQSVLDNYNKNHSKEIKSHAQGRILLVGHPEEKTFADGDKIKCMAEKGEVTTLAAGDSLHSYKYVSEFAKEAQKTVKVKTLDSMCTDCKGKKRIMDPNSKKINYDKCKTCNGKGKVSEASFEE